MEISYKIMRQILDLISAGKMNIDQLGVIAEAIRQEIARQEK